MKHLFNNNGTFERLKAEYLKYGNLIIGVDFDNTIYDTNNLGDDFTEVINLLKRCKTLGFTLCLFTLETDEHKLYWKEGYCAGLGIEPDYINDSPILQGARKPFFNVLLDDRAGLESAYDALLKLVTIIPSISNVETPNIEEKCEN